MLLPKSLLAIGLTILLPATITTAQEVECWAPDGETRADNTTYVPCNKLGITQRGVYSSCCNLDGRPGERDLCTTTGLCLNGSVLSRGYCTDRSWDSPACVNVCTDEQDSNGSQNGTVELTPCGDGTYCCGSNNLGCCDTDSAFSIPTQSSVIASNVTETAIVTETAAADASAMRGATIGLAVVLGVVTLFAVGAILWLVRRNKSLRRQLNEASSSSSDPQEPTTAVTQTPISLAARPYQESYLGGDSATNVTSSPNPQYSYYGKPPLSSAGVPTSPSEIDGQRYSELDATADNGNRGSLLTSPLREEGSPRGTPIPSPRIGSP